MKFLGVFIALTIAWSNVAFAEHEGYAQQHVKPITIKILSRDEKGTIEKEDFFCTPETYCFSEIFYCFMENGHCVCDLHKCEMWPDSKDEKTYWMEISGTEAERSCGRPRKLLDLTNLCLCDPSKNPPCGECNVSIPGSCRAPKSSRFRGYNL